MISTTRWKKLSMQEIEELWDRNPSQVLDEITQAFRAGTLFMFGVDKLEKNYRLTINQCLQGIYLIPDTEKVKQQRDQPLAAIAPDGDQADTADWRGERDIIFYVSSKEFFRFCQQADHIFREYHAKGLCFRMIPDLWFADTDLIQFIRERLWPHPAMQAWFGFAHGLPRISDFEWSPKFNR